jgi:molybdate transport system regulatory protein
MIRQAASEGCVGGKLKGGKQSPQGDKREGARKRSARAAPRLRIVMREGLILGPGKVDLIEAIERSGSISAAARGMGMSYRRAWLLVDALNHMFSEPVVLAVSGGTRGGGAVVTEFGKGVAAAYRRIEERTRSAILEELAPFDRALRS